MTNTILIDSPGFTAETQLGRLRKNLEVLQYIYSLSDLTLFFIASESINLVSSQISMLELSIMYAFHGETAFGQVLSEMFNAKDPSFSFSVSDLFSAVVRSLSKRQAPKTIYDGTSYWDKVKFILSKIDNVTLRCVCEKEIRPEAQFFELGTTLGKNLRFLKPPTFDQCFAIAIPEQQTYQTRLDQLNYLQKHDEQEKIKKIRTRRGNDSVITGDLHRLVGAISSLNFYDSFVVRLETSIQKMCEELLSVIKESWSYTTFLASSDVSKIESIYKKSMERSRDRVKSSKDAK